MKTFLIVLVVLVTTMLILSLIYLKTGFVKCIFHDLMGWHLPDNSRMFYGINLHSHCRFCGKEIMQDSQGNWF